MAINDTFHETATGIADGDEFIIEGAAADTGAAEVFELGGTGAATIYRDTDTTGDGTHDLSVQIDSTDAAWHSQQNQFVVSTSHTHRLRVVNTSGAAADYYVTGMEVSD